MTRHQFLGFALTKRFGEHFLACVTILPGEIAKTRGLIVKALKDRASRLPIHKSHVGFACTRLKASSARLTPFLAFSEISTGMPTALQFSRNCWQAVRLCSVLHLAEGITIRG
ncbi:MAG: hypothetical protein AAFO01_23110 [Pseudomonadota bacterium]